MAACLPMHVYFLLQFYIDGLEVLWMVNIASVLLWTLAGYLYIFRRRYVAAVLVGITELILHQLVAVLCLGLGSGFQYYLITCMIGVFLSAPRDRAGLSITLAIGAFVVFLALLPLTAMLPPLYALSDAELFRWQVVNTVFAGAGPLPMMMAFTRSLRRAEDRAAFEFERAENILRNILPDSIAERLKENASTIADGFDCTSVLFCDIVDFTKFAESRSPAEVVAA